MANAFVKVRDVIVNDVVAGNQAIQYVLGAPTGDVLAVWEGPGTILQTFDANGAAVSGEMTIRGRATWLSDGSFAVSDYDNASHQASVRHYSRTGTLLDTSANYAATGPTGVVGLANGNVLLTYGAGSQVSGQILDSSLDPVGTAFPLLSGSFFFAFEPLSNGGFIEQKDDVFWIYAADGSQVGVIDGNGELGAVAALPDGGFITSVSRNNQLDPIVDDGSSYGIVMRIYNADGTPRSAEFIANTTTQGDQSYSNVAVLDSQFFLVTWGPFQIHGQLFTMDGRKVGSEQLLDAAGATGSLARSYGWTLDSTSDGGFVSGQEQSVSGNGLDIELTYWNIDRTNILIGTAAGETFDGGGAADRIMMGYGGDDTYNVDSIGDEVTEIAGEGTDRIRSSIDLALTSNQDIELLQTNDNIGTAPLQLTGNQLSQYIYGNYGANRIDGGGGGDVMLGFAGDDSYYVRNGADRVLENAGEGTDRVYAATSWTLGAGQAVELLTMISNIATDPISLTGNALSQYIYGNYGDNVLDGGGGGDVLSGFLGNDTYLLRSAADRVYENAGEGNDTIRTAVSYALAAGQSIEALRTTDDAGTGAIDLTGNELAQTITGNAGNNVLRSGGGQDILAAGAGNDDYHITPDAILQEFAGQGQDRVFVSGGSYALAGSEIEILTPEDEFGTDPFNFTGNGYAQYVYGNDGANRIDGGGGGDILVGRGGDDQLFVRNAADQIREDANDGADRVFASTSWQLNGGAQVEVIGTGDNLGTAAINLTGNEFAQYVYGNAGSNTIGGAGGKDVLNGLGGADSFLFNTALNTAFTSSFASLADTANVDRIDGFAADDKIALSGALFGLTPGALSAGAFAMGTTAGDADDRVLYDAATGAILFDADGAGGAAAQLLAYINGPFNLDSSFFIVV